MCRKRKFRAASQSQSAIATATGLPRSRACATPGQPEEMIERDAVAFGCRRRHDHVVRGFQLGQISAGAKCRGLAGADDDARDIALRSQSANRPSSSIAAFEKTFIERRACQRPGVRPGLPTIRCEIASVPALPASFPLHFRIPFVVYYRTRTIAVSYCTSDLHIVH